MKKLFGFLIISVSVLIFSVSAFAQAQSDEITASATLTPADIKNANYKTASARVGITDLLFDFEDGFPFNAYFRGGNFVIAEGDTTTIVNSFNRLQEDGTTFLNGFSLKSGDINDNEAANSVYFVKIAQGGGTLRFRYKTSSEEGFDFLRVFVDGDQVAQFSGEQDWTISPEYSLPEGEVTIDFLYTKDGSQSTPVDAVFLDNISITNADATPTGITKMDPTSEAKGVPVDLFGTGFSPTAGLNWLYYDDVRYEIGYVISDNKLLSFIPSTIDPGNYQFSIRTPYGATDYSELISVLAPSEANYQIENFKSIEANTPSSVKTGDFDLDGIIDLVYGSEVDGTVSWFKGNGDGTFGEATLISGSVPNARSLAIADIDNDGDLDIIAGAFGSNQIIVFENFEGTGFSSGNVESSTAAGVFTLDTGDFNNDGFVDIVAGEFNSGTITTLLNNGNGTFGSKNSLGGSATNVTSVQAVDLDSDGDLDILSASPGDNKVAWYENNGVGNFSFQQVISTEGSGVNTAFAYDMNRDGLKDIIAISNSDESIRVYQNDGSTFSSQVLTNNAQDPHHIEAGDINGDGYLDILYSSNFTNRLYYMLNDTTDNFDFQAPVEIPGEVMDAYTFITKDLDSNGFLDIISAAADGSDIHIHYHGADNSTEPNPVSVPVISSITPSAGVAGSNILLTGINFSEIPDQNVVRFNGTQATVLGGNTSKLQVEVPEGLFGQATISIDHPQVDVEYAEPFRVLVENSADYENPFTTSGYNGEGNITTADIDGNGFDDLILTRPAFNRISMLFSDGNNPFDRSLSISITDDISPSIIKPINLDDQDYPDFVFISDQENEFRVLRNTGASPTSSSFMTQHTITANNIQPTDVAIADMDQDGRSDVIIASEDLSKISWYSNETTEMDVIFGNEQVVTTSAGGVSAIYAADFNADGFTDVVAGLAGAELIALYTNTGSGSFNTSFLTSFGSVSNPTEITAADLDDDGDLDVIASADGSIVTLDNNGDGSFTNFTVIANVQNASDIAVGDINGDTRLDVIASSQSTGEYFWLQNNGNIGFSSLELFPGTYSGAIDVEVYDMDANGQLDVAVRGANNGILSVTRSIFQPITGGAGVQILSFSSANQVVTDKDQLELITNTDFSSFNNAENWFQSSLRVVNSLETNFIPSGITVNGSSVLIDNSTLFRADTLNVIINANDLNRNSNGALYLDTNQNGFQDTGEDDYTSDPFYTTFIGDFNNDLDVDINDLARFREGWRTDDFNFETAPLDFSNGNDFPRAILTPDNDFNIDDLVAFIRYWNLSQRVNAKQKANMLASLNSGQSSNESLQNSSKLDVSESMKFIGFEEADRSPQYKSDFENSDNEFVYTFSLNHPDKVMALSLTLDYDESKLDIRSIDDHKLFDQSGANAHVFLTHVDSLNGVVTLNIANFGDLQTLKNRDIASVTFSSKTDQESELIIHSDILVENQPVQTQWTRRFISSSRAALPETFALSQNYPNPFNPTTSIQYELAEQSQVTISVFDILGRKIETLVSENNIQPGYYRVAWDASKYASGLYIYVMNLQSASGQHHTISKKMVLVK